MVTKETKQSVFHELQRLLWSPEPGETNTNITKKVKSLGEGQTRWRSQDPGTRQQEEYSENFATDLFSVPSRD